jgi:hypothetical protein
MTSRAQHARNNAPHMRCCRDAPDVSRVTAVVDTGFARVREAAQRDIAAGTMR